MDKSVKFIVRGLAIAALVFLGCVIGILIEQGRQERLEDRKESISAIAVVNMDDGVSVGEEHINYASQLMDFPNERFTVTGLSDAKTGIENGRYAAYVIIPETFSASVTSVENSPRKVSLEYQYNSKLDEETQIQAINDVNAFLNIMNSNIAYMYMDAILEEFHRVQDDAAAILANDNAELEHLQNVDIPRLIAAFEPIEEGTVDFDIQPVELVSYISQNDILLESLLSGYLMAYRQGEDELSAIRETSTGIETASFNFFSMYNEMIAGAAGERAALLETARTELEKAVGVHASKIKENRQETEKMLSDVMAEQLKVDRESANMQLEAIIRELKGDSGNSQTEWQNAYMELKQEAQDDLQGQLDACQTSVERCLEELARDAYRQGFSRALDALSEGISSLSEAGNPENITAEDVLGMISGYKGMELSPEPGDYGGHVEKAKAILGAVSIPWDDLGVMLSSTPFAKAAYAQPAAGQFEIVLQPCETVEVKDKAEELMDLFALKAETEEVKGVIQTYFVDAISDKEQSGADDLAQAMDVLDRELEQYQSSLIDYDPSKYLENAGLNTYLRDIGANAGNMMDAIGQNNAEYMAYSAEVYRTAAKNMAELKDSLNASNEKTSENVENCINELVDSREAINGENVNMLEAFTDSLRYTRVESRANSEVYDLIVNPIVPQRTGQFITRTPRQTSAQENYVQEILVILLGIGIAVAAIELFRSVLQRYKKRQESIRSTE